MQKGELFYDAKNFNWSYNTLTIKILIHTSCETHDLALAVTATANAGSQTGDARPEPCAMQHPPGGTGRCRHGTTAHDGQKGDKQYDA